MDNEKPAIKKGDWLTFVDPRGDEFGATALEDETPGKDVLRVLWYREEILLPVKDILR